MTRTRRTFLTALVGGAAALLGVRRPAGPAARLVESIHPNWKPKRGDFRQTFHPENWESGEWYNLKGAELGGLKDAGYYVEGGHLGNGAVIVEVDQINKTVTFAKRMLV